MLFALSAHADDRTSISGWLNVAATTGSGNNSLLPAGFNYLNDNGQLQQAWLRIDRAMDNDAPWSIGGRLDLLAGTDYRFTLPRGLWNYQLDDNDGQPNRYGFDPVQAYVALHLHGEHDSVWQLGRFYAPYGVESIEAVSSPLPTRSYTFIYNPYTQVGLIHTHYLTPNLTLVLGLTAGNDVVINEASQPTLDAGLKWTTDDQNTSAALFAIVGEGRFDTKESFNNPNILDLTISHKLNPTLTASLETLVGSQRDVPGVGTATWQSAAAYLTKNIQDDLSATARLEIFNDEDGNRTGTKTVYNSAAASLAYSPNKWITLRPELRYDIAANGQPFSGKDNVFITTLDCLLRW